MKKLVVRKITMSVFLISVCFAGYKTGHSIWAWKLEYDQKKILFGHRAPAAFAGTKVYPGGLTVSIVATPPGPVAPGQPFTLTASIAAQEDIPGLKLRWHFPKSMTVVSGSEKLPVSIIADQTVTSSITLISPDEENYRIVAEVFHSKVESDGQRGRRGAVALYNTNPSKLDPIHQNQMQNTSLAKTHSGNKPHILQ